MGLDDSGGAGLKARIRVLRLTPHAEASDDWYAAASGAGFLDCERSSLSSSRLRPSKEREGSSSDVRPFRSNVLAALANTDEPSPVELDLGRCSMLILPVPTLQVASLAVRLGMKRSAELYAILVFVGRDRRVTSFFAFGVLVEVVVVVPVPVSAHSDTPSSNRRGELRAMFDLGESRVVLETECWMRAMKLPP